jgi:hypothetical protein
VSYSKVGDTSYVARIAAIARLPERHASTELNRLAALGVIIWKPARGRSMPSWIGLPSATSKTRPAVVPYSAGKPDRTEPENPTGGGPPSEKYREDDDVQIREELRSLVQPLGMLYPSQLAEVAQAYEQSPHGVARCVSEARAARADRPAALFVSMIRAGAHLQPAVSPIGDVPVYPLLTEPA